MSLKILDLLNDCTACGACASVCPKNAITILPYNKVGFYYPALDKDLCVKCGLCEKTCPQLSKFDDANVQDPLVSVMLQAKSSEDVVNASSGGVIPVFYNEILNRGGVVWGSAYSFTKKILETKSSRAVSIDSLRKSKYIETYNNTVFREVRQELINDNWCLFVGTPCQISGLKNYLKLTKTSDKKLLTVRFP